MQRFILSLLVLLLTILGAWPAAAQAPGGLNSDAVKRPDTTALGDFAARLGKAGAGQGQPVTATHFTPSGQRLTRDDFVQSLAASPDQQAGLRQILDGVFTAYETEAAKSNAANDVAAALTFYLTAEYSAFHDGRDVSEAASNALMGQLRTALNTDAMRAAPNEEKQKLYEYLVLMGGFTATMQQLGTAQKDATMQKAARQLGASGLKALLHVEAGRVGIGATGLTIAPEPGAARPAAGKTATGAAGPGGPVGMGSITYRIPAGWTEEKNAAGVALWHNKTADDPTAARECVLSVATGLAKTGSLANTLHTLWRDTILPTFEGTAKPFPNVCQLPGGINCVFGTADMINKSNHAKYGIAAYAIDAGDSVVLVTVIYWTEMVQIFAEKEWSAPIFEFFDSLKIRGAPLGKPVATRGELTGTWSNSAYSSASYVTSAGDYSGDASIATAENYVFHADGTYSHLLIAMQGSRHVKEKEAGTYRVEKNMVVMTPKGAGRVVTRQFMGRGVDNDDKGTLIYLGSERTDRDAVIGNFYKDRFYLKP